jgi:hypothetical protein
MQSSKLILLVIALWLVGFSFFVAYSHTFLFNMLQGRSSSSSSAERRQILRPQRRLPSEPQLNNVARPQQAIDPDEKRIEAVLATTTASKADENSWPWRFSHDELAWRAEVFVNMAAYRDKRCHHTIWQAITRAANPSRVRFGVFQQHDDATDPDCLAFQRLCSSTGKDAKAHIPLDPNNEYVVL